MANHEPQRLDAVPEFAPAEFQAECLRRAADGARLVALCALSPPPPDGSAPKASELLAVLARDARGELELLRMTAAAAYPALTQSWAQAQAFEREIFEEHGIRPEGHPWLKPLRRHGDLEPAGTNAAPIYPYFSVEGAGIHEVAVGPVHAGVIEPGSFRFQCHGETVLHLEIQLGYQRRGAEALLLRSSPGRRLMVAESIAGDTVIAHALAHCMAVESLAGVDVPGVAQLVRGVALELERLHNHVGDLGALANDVGYLPGASWLGRLRGEFLNLLMEISGNRFGRSLLCAGGVRFGIDAGQRDEFLRRLRVVHDELKSVVLLMLDTPSVQSRFEGTGVVSKQTAETIGLVGMAARASGCQRDVRRDHASGIYRIQPIEIASATGGDVMARARLRWEEVEHSLAYVRARLSELPTGALIAKPAAWSLAPDSVVVSMVEGWRGETVHILATDAAGALCRHKVIDPSLHNWFGLAMAMRDGDISDFPLCNKSFNLSYAGHDL